MVTVRYPHDISYDAGCSSPKVAICKADSLDMRGGFRGLGLDMDG